MKKLFLNRAVLASLFFVLGGVFGWSVNQYFKIKQINESRSLFSLHHNGSLFDIFFDSSSDPFNEMRKMQKQMLEEFSEEKVEPLNSFGLTTKQNAFSIGGFEQREDEENVYYEFKLEGQKPKEIKADIQDGQVSISGQIEIKNEEEGSHSYYSSSFHRSFPVPADVDADKFKLEQADDKITIKFPKIKTT